MKVSIIMSVYNESDQVLKQAIESILNQTYKEFEYIIVLDNPGNIEAKKIILRYKENDKRIIFYENKINVGLANSLNKAISLSSSKLIARMDADDISSIDRIEKQVYYMNRNPEVDLLSGRIQYIDEHDQIITRENRRYSQTVIKKILPYINPFNHPTWVFRAEILKKLSGYRNFSSAQDYDFILRAKSMGYNLHIMDDVVLKYRIRRESISSSNSVAQQMLTLYIQKLYRQRKKIGSDKFEENYITEIYENRDFIRYKESTAMYNKYKDLKRKGYYIKSIILLVKSFQHSKYQCKSFYNSLMVKIILVLNRK